MHPQWSRLAHLLNGLGVDIPCPFDLHTFVRAVERHRRRTIKIVYTGFGDDGAADGIVTWWWSYPRTDYIVTDADAAKPLQDHGILHEVSHMLLAHVGRPLAHTMAGRFQHLDSRAVLRALARDVGRYDDPDEADAEALATLIPVTAPFRGNRRPNTGASGLAREHSPISLPCVTPVPTKHRLYRDIWPLWHRLIERPGMPHLAPLPEQPPHPQLDLLLRRMVVETLDGLHRLRPLRDPDVAAAARTRAVAAGLHPQNADAVAEAAAINAAIGRARHARPGHHTPPGWPDRHYTHHAGAWGPRAGGGFAAHSVWLAKIGQVLSTSPALAAKR